MAIPGGGMSADRNAEATGQDGTWVGWQAPAGLGWGCLTAVGLSALAVLAALAALAGVFLAVGMLELRSPAAGPPQAASASASPSPSPRPSPSPSPATATVAAFRGSGADTTPVFQVASGWQIHWQTSAQHLIIAVYDASGTVVAVAVNEQGPAAGVSMQPNPGSYYLQVTAFDGDWSVTVTPAT